MRRAPALRAGWALAAVFAASAAGAAPGTVPDEFASIQAALDQAAPGDTLLVKDSPGPYFEKIEFVSGGSAAAGFVSLEAYPGHKPVIDGSGVPGSDLVLIDDLSYVRVKGFELRKNLGVSDGSGVRVVGSGSHIEIVANSIHDIRGSDAMGITVYGTSPSSSISDLLIDGNTIYDCEPARSEALTLNGNVERFIVSNNVVRDVNNIGIDFIGGETSINPDPTKVARDGVCRFNQVYRARSIYDGGWGAGIYVDGGRDIVVEGNLVTGSDLGIEIGAENPGVDATGIVVRDNLIYRNEKAGLVFGGYDASVGRTRNCRFLNNTCFMNDTLGTGLGELWIQFAADNLIANNIFASTTQGVLTYSEQGNVANTLDWNLWWTPAGTTPEFTWRGTSYASLAAFQAATGQDASSLYADPLLAAPAADNLHLSTASPAVDRGDPAFSPASGETDIDLEPRVAGGRVDIGADELAPACAVAGLEAVDRLLARKDAGGVRFSWTATAGAAEHHVNAVVAKAELIAPGPRRAPYPGGVGVAACEAASPATECADAGALAQQPDLVYYRAVAACSLDGDGEGPLD